MNRIVLFEKNPFFRESLLRIIEYRFPDVVTKSVFSPEECMTEMSTFIPDILILGLNAYSGTELALLDHIHKKHPSANIILFTDYNIDEYRKEAILKGASHIISRELWTGNEILALISTIFRSKKSLKSLLVKGFSTDKNFLEQPIERRKRESKGSVAEKEFLAQHTDRRKKNKK